MTKREAMELTYRRNQLIGLGISIEDTDALRRISMTLHRWSERECGDGNGCIERDDTTGRPMWRNSMTGRAYPIPDREKGALTRLKAIMGKYPQLRAYAQGDPRGAALWILRPGDVPEGCADESYYNNGIAVY
jgi:hypothetical protein